MNTDKYCFDQDFEVCAIHLNSVYFSYLQISFAYFQHFLN
jgi:hypothetical protein